MESGGATGTLQLMVLTFVTVNSQSKIHYVFTTPVSPGDYPLSKKPEYPGYRDWPLMKKLNRAK